MSIPDKQSNIQPNVQRRRLVQGTVLAGAALGIPGMANAVCAYGNHGIAQSKQALDPSSILTNDDVTIELVETKTSLSSGNLARVTITNRSDRPIKISDVSPMPVATRYGVYDLHTTLAKNPLAMRSGGTYQFWLTADDSAQARLSIESGAQSKQAANPLIIQVSEKV